MKELSIGQKAKAYDKALSVARKTHQTQPMYRDWLEKMFPELAESEDERMIKFIKNQLFNIKKTITDNYKLDTELTKAIDWLEKQGEKPQRIVSAEAKEAMYDKPAPLRTGAIGFDGESMESKPCEQKSAEQCDTNKEFSEAVSEKIRNMVSRLFNGDGNITSKEFADQFAWELLTLARYEIQKEQKPAEWSEEDEEISSAIVKRLEGSCALSVDLQSAICWVENVKDRVQSQWKPSEEQIKAIRIARSFVISDNPILSELLVELEEQLKKLREE